MKLSTVLSAFLVCTPVALAVLAPPSVAQAADGAAVLAKLDRDAEAFADVSYVSSMEIWKKGSKKKTLQFDMVMKGLDKQYINFTAPGDVAGMKILMVGSELWMYSPEFQKVRKIAAHAQSQGFLGSEFTPEDMVMTNMSRHFTADISGQKGNETYLTLTPKADFQTSWSKLELTIDKTKGGVTKIKYFDGSGTAVREQTRGGWSKISGKAMPTQIKMKNLKTGAETVIQLSDIKVDQGVEDALFSRRTLLR
ncbi:Outer membrane lipoprotein carrier protein LolA [Enhygromyxa salina]|uniref:Outer membrane lipoprotein carrier protein LolA n=1 Tax=Enhygromyxa salina TaxID=215803 RepID=A0A2S9YCV3_9BACT|nr:outer membrane lipoprotein-sorting protein [Enhygromyxa salina]PRQ02947.1 Outer membrane lipoprotein carrier protein LolA [Enhygromyxa salina]